MDSNTIYYATSCVALVTAFLLYLRLRSQNTPLNIPGPPSPSYIFGHMPQILLSPRYGDHEFEWLRSYGSVYRLKKCFGQDRLMVADPLALQHILHSPDFCLAPLPKNVLGSEHRELRSALNVGFTAAAVRNYQPVFQKAAQMISDEFESSSAVAIDVCPLLCTATLGAASETLLGHSIQALGEDFVANNLQMLALSGSQSKGDLLIEAIGAYLPKWIWRATMHLPITAVSTLRKGKHLADRIGGRIARERIDAMKQGLDVETDLFSVLLHATTSGKMKTELKENDVVAQTLIVLLAGQEPTARTLHHGLRMHPDFQDKLRAEIHSNVGGGTGNVAYDNMPLLDAFIKETLRLYPAMPLFDRVAEQDTIIPLAESITTSTGESINQIPVQKGQLLTLAIASYQRLAPHWGKDPLKFDPSRWLEGTPYKGDAVGPYANLLNFLGGPRTCLG
ncbi:Cytochrome P450 [Mycena venus]|uniref:Cytochrome P450 n=1 Tax=Mycena venus TaxID=2733690 RepID=A0A8H6XF21_9AGAR|nr:Cytochrome P450 [Mycena venus]